MTYQAGITLKQIEKIWLIGALMYHQGNRTKAAESLGVSIKTIYNKVEEYGIQIPARGIQSEEERAYEIAAASRVESTLESSTELPLPMRQREKVQEVPPASAPISRVESGRKKAR